jgi:hypothetical protein
VTIITVMAWTDGSLPTSWDYALAHVSGPTELRLRSFFHHFENPQRDPLWRSFLASPDSTMRRLKKLGRKLWSEVWCLSNSETQDGHEY